MIHDVEFAPGVAWPVNSRTAQRHLESQHRIVAQRLAHADEVLALDMNGELTAIDHDLFDRIIEVGAECCLRSSATSSK